MKSKMLHKVSGKAIQIAVYVQKKYRMRNKINELSSMPKFNAEAIKKTKRSDVLFILGSSRLINELSEDNWDIVSTHNSMALNNFCFHKFVPDYYWIEVSGNIPAMHYTFKEMQSKYSGVEPIFVLNYDNIRKSCVSFKRLPDVIVSTGVFIQPKAMFSCSRNEIRSNLKTLEKEVNNNRVGWYSFQHIRGSLFTCCQIGWALGFKEIVLLGVSLNDQRYFYEEVDSSNAAEMIKMNSIQDIYEGRVGDVNNKHRTIREDSGTQAPPVTELIKMLYREFLLPSGVQLYVQSQESLLAGDLPVYEWGNI